jgi:hypothetical protein
MKWISPQPATPTQVSKSPEFSEKPFSPTAGLKQNPELPV